MSATNPPPPPSFPPPSPGPPVTPPPGPGSSNGPGWVLILVGGVLATLALVAALVLLWPSGDDDDPDEASSSTTVLAPLPTGSTVPGASGEPSESDGSPSPGSTAPVDLFESGADEVYADLVRAAGATQVLDVAIYPEYAFLAYRDPVEQGNIDERQWRDGEVGPAEPNLIDDRFDEETAAKVFAARALDLSILPDLVDDAAGRFTLPVEVTHVLIDRFLPFDDRVLIRVYATPTDGRSGGGYVQYTVDGTYVKTIG